MPALEDAPKTKTSPEDGPLLIDLEEHSLEAKKVPFFHRRRMVLAIAIAAVLAIAYGATVFYHQLTHESTDDAFLDAHIISVAPKIEGRVSTVKVNENQLVNKGDLLVEIDPRDAEAAVAQKRAALEVAQARLENAQMSAEQAEAHVKTLEAVYASTVSSTNATAAETEKAQGDLARNSGLMASGAISKMEFQHSESDANSSAANLDSKKKQLQAAAAYAEEGKKQAGSARAQTKAAEAEVAQAEAELHQAELQRSYTRITAPDRGRATSKSVEPGNYLQIGQPIFAVVPQQVWVIANFKETQLSEMRPGQTAEVEVDAYPAQPLRGHVESIQAGSGARFSLLPPENATGNFVKIVQRVPVKIVFDEQPDARHVLGPGMSAVPEVRVSFGLRPLLTVTVSALLLIGLVVGVTTWWLRRISP